MNLERLLESLSQWWAGLSAPTLFELLVSVLLLFGSLLILAAGIGLLRFPDIFCRMHAAGKAVTLGIAVLIVAVMVYFLGAAKADTPILLRGMLAIVFQFFTTPAGTHLLARAAYVVDYPLSTRTVTDELQVYLDKPAKPGGAE